MLNHIITGRLYGLLKRGESKSCKLVELYSAYGELQHARRTQSVDIATDVTQEETTRLNALDDGALSRAVFGHTATGYSRKRDRIKKIEARISPGLKYIESTINSGCVRR